MDWTVEQKKVIEVRNKNVLVSAAAGSGKTAVLVEHIISLITEKESSMEEYAKKKSPLDIDELLIVTFTNAAAAEMRERIGTAIEKAVEADPENIHMQKQQTLIHTAPITTIDSFCLKVVREHFDMLELDPAFRIGDEGEKKLFKSDVVKELLEDYYGEGREEFFRFVEGYSTGKSDAGIEELILRLYEFSMSNPDPQEWLTGCAAEYQVTNLSEWNETKAMAFLMDYLKRMAQDMKERALRAIHIIEEGNGPYMYEAALQSDLLFLENLCKMNTYESFGGALKAVSFTRLSSKRDACVDDMKKEQVKRIRDSIKQDIKDITKQFYFRTPEQMLEDIASIRSNVEILIELTQEFIKRYQEKKREKNILDFHDIEHFALEILTEKREDGKRMPSSVAAEYRESYKEIMIDEYQDSNLVQEEILTSVSRIWEGKPNIFMVGDVKQSIYKFRLARPELFMQKYKTYQTDGEKEQRIDLHKNFRSREEVLKSVNDIFFRIMTQDLGKISYTKEAALYTGAVFEPDTIVGAQDRKTELYVIERQTEDGEENKEDYTSIELEAKVIAKRIRELTREGTGLPVWDKEKKCYRTAKYGDIVILLRAISGFTEGILNVFLEESIPAYAQSQTGYFTALEVQTALNMLKIIDNPRQDIPLAGILRSPIGRINSEELAYLRAFCPEGDMLDIVTEYLKKGEDKELKQKLNIFMDLLKELRDMASYTSIHDLLNYLLKRTGYGDFVKAMPAGKQRSMNLDMLLEKAVAFEKTSLRGLFHFIRYIEKLQKYDIDFGEASIIGENENTVRIMSIHKSKGLEFPIVFLAGMGKRFNQQDALEKVVIHPDLGIGGDFVDYEKRIKTITLTKKILQKCIRLENLGEELRILYVAMTRAKEKLIMTGTVRKAEDGQKKWEEARALEGPLSYSVLCSANSYFDWICSSYKESSIRMEISNPNIVVRDEMIRQDMDNKVKEILENWNTEIIYQEEIKKEIEERFSYQYPYEEETVLHGKTSVSEVKRMSQKLQLEEEETGETIFVSEPIVPRFLSEQKEETGAERGTAYHTALQFLPFWEQAQKKDVERYKEELVKEQKLSLKAASYINSYKILAFLHSPLAKRMKAAKEKNMLYRERQFVVGIPANELYTDCESEELIVLQGIIDAYFEEEGEIVLVDFKTDYIKKQEEGEALLKKRYQTQFDCYKKALKKMTGKNVKETILYSLSLEKELYLE